MVWEIRGAHNHRSLLAFTVANSTHAGTTGHMHSSVYCIVQCTHESQLRREERHSRSKTEVIPANRQTGDDLTQKKASPKRTNGQLPRVEHATPKVKVQKKKGRRGGAGRRRRRSGACTTGGWGGTTRRPGPGGHTTLALINQGPGARKINAGVARVGSCPGKEDSYYTNAQPFGSSNMDEYWNVQYNNTLCTYCTHGTLPRAAYAVRTLHQALGGTRERGSTAKPKPTHETRGVRGGTGSSPGEQGTVRAGCEASKRDDFGCFLMKRRDDEGECREECSDRHSRNSSQEGHPIHTEDHCHVHSHSQLHI